ncbi:hypothetical protein F4811DRAFT_536036 [Daldinia bambusicola]|nr:hypothetical protein F4811DRAFT_536036 [Daldinia bambusicola]
MPVPGSLPIVDENTLRQMDVLMFVVLSVKQRSVAEFETFLRNADERYEIKYVYSKARFRSRRDRCLSIEADGGWERLRFGRNLAPGTTNHGLHSRGLA